MELRNPESKGYKRNNSRPSCPLPILNETDGLISFDDEYWPSFTGHFNGSSVIIDNPQEMLTLYSKGFFGKGSLSKGPPKIYSEKNVKCEVITEKQWKRRKQWIDTSLSKKRKEDTDVSGVKEDYVKKSKKANENVSEQIITIDVDTNKKENDEKMDVDETTVEESNEENVAKFSEERVTTISIDRKVDESIEKDTESEVEKVVEKKNYIEEKNVIEINSDTEHEEIEKTIITTDRNVDENLEKDNESQVSEKLVDKKNDNEVVSSVEKKVIEINSDAEHEEIEKTVITTDRNLDENLEKDNESQVSEKVVEKKNDNEVVSSVEKHVIEIISDTEHEEIEKRVITNDRKVDENIIGKPKSEIEKVEEIKNDLRDHSYSLPISLVVNNEERMVIEINSDTEQEKTTITTDRKVADNGAKVSKSEVEKEREKENANKIVSNEEKMVIEINSDTENERSSDKLYIIEENVETGDAEGGSREKTKRGMKEINISLNTKQWEYTRNERYIGECRNIMENNNCYKSKKSVDDRSHLGEKQVLVVSDDRSDLTEDIVSHLKPRLEIESIKTVIEVLYLSLEEAFFLSYALNCLNVVGLDGKFLKMKDMWNLYVKSQSDFIEKYVAYHYFRAKGWVVRTGEKYAAHFVLYKKGPQHYHSSYVVHVRSENRNEDSKIVQNKIQFTWDMLIGDNRLAETAKKEVLFAYVMFPDVSKEKLKDPSILKEFQIRELLARRWLPSSVEIQEKKD